MPHHQLLDQWIQDVSSQFPEIHSALLRVASWYAFGMAISKSCGQTMVSEFLGQLYGIKVNTMRQRLREVTYEADAKRGEQRQALDVKQCFAPLFSWILNQFNGETKQVVIAMDATHLGTRFTILAVSVVIQGAAIPVAWHIRKADQKGKWNPIWQDLLTTVAGRIDPTWQVSVLADSGLYSRDLFFHIRDQLHWHPHMRITQQGLCRHPNGKWVPIAQLATQGMSPMVSRMICFKGNPLICTVLIEWQADYDKPCVVVTDLPPQQANPLTYHLRFWIEAGFRDLKRGGLHWERTQITCPDRMSRLWFVMSLALVFLITHGMLDPCLVVTPDGVPRLKSSRLSCLSRGWIHLLVALITHHPLPAVPLLSYPTAFLPNHTYP